MIWVLQIDRGFYFEFCGWISVTVLQANANSADAAFEESAGRVRNLSAIECAVEADDVFIGEEAVQDRTSWLRSVKISLVVL